MECRAAQPTPGHPMVDLRARLSLAMGTLSVGLYLSRIMRKPAFACAKTKAQISFAVTAKLIMQRLCFRYTDNTIPLLPKSEISSL